MTLSLFLFNFYVLLNFITNRFILVNFVLILTIDG